jgi:hypothetical protein
MGDRHSHVEQFFGFGIKGSRTHHLLDALPRTLERDRIVGERAPEIVDELGFADGADVVKDGTSLGGRVRYR